MAEASAPWYQAAVCSPKPAWEILSPREPVDFEAAFDAHFKGMTAEPVTTAQLLETRARLLSRITDWLDEASRAFLWSVENEQPDFRLIGLHHAKELPGVRRKLQNLQATAGRRPPPPATSSFVTQGQHRLVAAGLAKKRREELAIPPIEATRQEF